MGCSWSSTNNNAVSNSAATSLQEKQYQTSGGGVLSGKYDIKKPALKNSTTNQVPQHGGQPPLLPTAPQIRHPSPTKPRQVHPTTVSSGYTPYYDKLPPKAIKCRVHHVYDGDTLTLENEDKKSNEKKRRVRFLGMDTPELKPVQAFAQEAKAYTESRCNYNNSSIWISYENSKEEKDTYGRLLAWVWVKSADNNKYECVNEGLVQAGLASVYFPSKSTPLSTRTKLVAMQKEARLAKRGMWHTFQDSTVLQTPHGVAYHHPNGKCDHLKRSSPQTLQRILETVAMDQGRHACRTCLADEGDENVTSVNNKKGTSQAVVSVY